ncbi:hypothetical protein Tco_1026505 [Tanacetum coccineum]
MVVDFKSKEDTLKFDIGGHTLELGRIEFSLLTGFSIGKVIFPKVKTDDIPPFVRHFVKDDEKWKNISDVDVVRVYLLLMAEHVFMGREANHVMGKPIMMLAENLTAWDNFPWDDNVFPRCLAWGDTNNRFEKQNYGELLGELMKTLRTRKMNEGNMQIWIKEFLQGTDAGESSGEETVEEDKHSRRELELERLLRQVESRLHTVEMESTKLKEEFAYLRKENDAPHEKVNQEISYAADALHTMALDEDAKVCTDEPKPSTTLHSFIPADGVQFMALYEDAKVCIYEEPKPSTSLHSDIPADDVQSIPFDDDAKDMRAEYMNEELRSGSHNKEPLSKQPYVPFRMHTRSRDYQPLDKQPEDKLVHVNAKVDSLLVSLDTAVVDETADKQILKRPTGAPKSKTVVPIEIVEFLRSDGNQKFSFPWVEKNFEVDKQFWSRLLGLHPHRNGWLMDCHLDLWIRYMWRTRPDSANWTMCSAIFCPHILGKGLPSSYNVTDALFPKGCLAELHISSGVITFHDSLGPGKEPEESDWWVEEMSES